MSQGTPPIQNGTSTAQRHPIWTWIAACVAVFMVSMDNLVVTNALPVIRVKLGAGLEGLEWTVNAYTLTFAVLLLTGAALGDRFGRRRLFTIGLVIFTLASAAAAMAPDIGTLIAARAVQGVGGAIVMPLTLTLLASIVAPERRGVAFGVWGAMGGLGVALGPVVGGAITTYASWQWIFWVNVPIGLLLLPILAFVRESRGGAGLDLVGTGLVTAGLFGVVFGVIRGNSHGWSSPQILTSLIGGAVFLVTFIVWESRAAAPMVPLKLFRDRGFTLTNVVSLFMAFGMFGAVFLSAQFLQTVQGYTPLQSGIRTLPWTAMPVIAAPLAGIFSNRIGARRIVALGLLCQAVAIGWLAAIIRPDLPYSHFIAPFVIAGTGMGLFFAPIARLVIDFAPAALQGVASGTSNALRQLGTVLGVAVLGAVFSAVGGFTSADAFVKGLRVASWTGAAVLAVAVVLALAIPAARTAPDADEPVLAPDAGRAVEFAG